jgi:xanthine/CO dehydrogenase XdhC/CoxF family maturation factor
MNPEMLRRIVALLDRRVSFAVATVVQARGSVPGKVGARMIVRADGSQEGTVGGAGLEEKVKKLALAAIAGKTSGTHHFELARQKPDGLDSVCGGGVEVFVEYMAPGPHLLIYGCGHVGEATAQFCDQLDYAYSVADVTYERQYNHAAVTRIHVGEVLTQSQDFPVGTYIVPTAQYLGRLAAHMLEVETEDNVVYWNTMDAWVPRPGSEPTAGPPLSPIVKLMTPTALTSQVVDPAR